MATDPQPIRKSDLPTTPPPEFEFFTWFPWPDGDGGDMVRGQRQRGVQVRRLVTYGDWEPVRPDRWADEPAPAGLGVSATPSHTDQAFVLWLDASDGSVPTHDGIVWPDGTATIHHRHFGHTTTHASAEAARQAAHGQQGRIVWPKPAHRAAVLAEVLPDWEAVYEPGNVSDYLIGYANDQDAATGMAEAWMRSQAEVTGRLEWVSEERMATGRYDRWFELIERHDDGIDTGPGIIVRRRLADEAQQQPEPPVHGESVAHLAGLHNDEPTVEVRQDGACPPGCIACATDESHDPTWARQDGAQS